VLWAADAGVTVRKGDVLVKLDTRDLDQAIKDIEAGRALSDLAWTQAGEELRLLDKDVQEQLAHAERIKQRTDEDLRYYRKGQAPFRPKYLALHKKRTDLWLESVQTELRELKRMYEADDLVESTEGLVLKRQQLRLDWEKLDHEKNVKFAIPRIREVEIPRTKEDQEKTVRDAAAALDKARTALPLLLQKKKLEIEKMKYDRAKAAEHLAKLKADRKTMIVRAPAGGVVYYGQCVRGRWTSVDKAAAQLRKGGQLGPHQVFITIVDTRRMFVRAGAAEQHLRDLRKGMDALVTPTGYPDGKLVGEVDSVTIQPGGPEKYTIRVSAPRRRGLLPGMTCKVRLVAYERKRAITVPAAAVFAEPGDPDSRYVYLQPADGKKPAKRPVTGKSSSVPNV
jgi:HlyD family secretion protein